ncbi:unnamed protein product, partial [marine sediment metagenome]
QVEKEKYIDLKEPGKYVNHSCNPNVGIKKDKKLVAIKNIKKGEEIFWDYSTSMDEDNWTMKCKCGNKDCRKIIKDFKYLPERTKNKYLKMGIVQKFIAKKFKK